MFKSKLLSAIFMSLGFGGIGQVIADGPRQAAPKRTRSRISGKVHTSGNKLARKAAEGKLGLRNTTDGGFGENLRRKMNRDAGPKART